MQRPRPPHAALVSLPPVAPGSSAAPAAALPLSVSSLCRYLPVLHRPSAHRARALHLSAAPLTGPLCPRRRQRRTSGRSSGPTSRCGTSWAEASTETCTRRCGREAAARPSLSPSKRSRYAGLSEVCPGRRGLQPGVGDFVRVAPLVAVF